MSQEKRTRFEPQGAGTRLAAGSKRKFAAEAVLKRIERDKIHQADHEAVLKWGGKQVPIEKIEIEPALFQHRNVAQPSVDRLMSALAITGELQPVTVIATGDRIVLVEGHHRRAAYWRAGRETMPVKWWHGSAREAIAESFRENGMVREQVSHSERQDFAWRLVRFGFYTKPEIARIATISNGQVGNMRAALAQLGEKALSIDSWHKAYEMSKGHEADGFDPEVELDGWVKELALKWSNATKPSWRNNPTMLARSFLILAGHHAPEAVKMMAHELGDAIDWTKEQEAEEVGF